MSPFMLILLLDSRFSLSYDTMLVALLKSKYFSNGRTGESTHMPRQWAECWLQSYKVLNCLNFLYGVVPHFATSCKKVYINQGDVLFPLDNKLCKQKIKYGRNRHDVTHWLVKSHSEVFQSCFLKLTVTRWRWI